MWKRQGLEKLAEIVKKKTEGKYAGHAGGVKNVGRKEREGKIDVETIEEKM